MMLYEISKLSTLIVDLEDGLEKYKANLDINCDQNYNITMQVVFSCHVTSIRAFKVNISDDVIRYNIEKSAINQIKMQIKNAKKKLKIQIKEYLHVRHI